MIIVSLERPHASNICSIFPPCIKSKALEKSRNCSVASRFCAPTFSMIELVIRICEVVDRFLQKPFRFFQRIFSISAWILLRTRTLFVFTNPSARAGYNTRSIFKQSLTGLNSEFSFSLSSCIIKAKEPSLPYYLPIGGGRIIEFIPFPSAMWNAISLVQDLNSCCRVLFLQR